MRRDELTELHYITLMANVPSILEHGLLSHRGVAKIPHESIAKEEVQDRRRLVRLPTGLMLHEYVNLYVYARNAMMYKRRDLHDRLCVLIIRTDVLDIPGVVVTDRNAATDFPRFDEPVAGLTRLDKDLVFAEWWFYPGDPVTTAKHRAIMCAEVLVPYRVGPEHVLGAYTSCEQAKSRLLTVAPELSVIVNGYMLFRPGGR